MIKGTTLLRNVYLPITKLEDSKGMLETIEEENTNKDNTKKDIQSLRGNLETLRMDHDSFQTSAEREKNGIHKKIKMLEVSAIICNYKIKQKYIS